MGRFYTGVPARRRQFVERSCLRQESLRALSKRHGINPKTAAKWRARNGTADIRPGPKDAHSTSLSIEEEAVVSAFRRHALLPLDDCLYAPQATIGASDTKSRSVLLIETYTKSR
jgi:transposase-like protein